MIIERAYWLIIDILIEILIVVYPLGYPWNACVLFVVTIVTLFSYDFWVILFGRSRVFLHL